VRKPKELRFRSFNARLLLPRGLRGASPGRSDAMEVALWSALGGARVLLHFTRFF
jgi:hypothetical protein